MLSHSLTLHYQYPTKPEMDTPNDNKVLAGTHVPNANTLHATLMRELENALGLTMARAAAEGLQHNASKLIEKIAPIILKVLMSAGITVLLPSLAVAIVNAIGFTSGGVLAGAYLSYHHSYFITETYREPCGLVTIIWRDGHHRWPSYPGRGRSAPWSWNYRVRWMVNI